MDGWGKIAAGVILGVAGTVYATNENARKNLPKGARDLPENVRRRFGSAVSAAREASARRRAEILRDLEEHDRGERAVEATAEDLGIEQTAEAQNAEAQNAEAHTAQTPTVETPASGTRGEGR